MKRYVRWSFSVPFLAGSTGVLLESTWTLAREYNKRVYKYGGRVGGVIGALMCEYTAKGLRVYACEYGFEYDPCGLAVLYSYTRIFCVTVRLHVAAARRP